MAPVITEAFDGLLAAISLQRGCEAVHVECGEVAVVLADGSAWLGTVHTFDLTGHPFASRAFAWYPGPTRQRVIFEREAEIRDMWDAMQAIREASLRAIPGAGARADDHSRRCRPGLSCSVERRRAMIGAPD